MTEIRGKNVLITGAACGIGRRMAHKIADFGGTVVGWDLHQPNLDRLVSDLKASSGRDAYGYVCDVSEKAKVYEVADQVKKDVGEIDILINNAGVVSGKPFLELPDEKIEATFAVNTLAHFWTSKAFLPGMMSRNSGHVVTVASSAGLVGVAKLSDYCASKWAAVGFDESLRMELNKTAPGVKTTVVCPFFIDTGMFDGVKTRFPLILPILREDEVADKVVRAIQHNTARVILPPLVGVVPVARALPVKVFDTVANILGINASMEDFVGRPKPSKPAGQT